MAEPLNTVALRVARRVVRTLAKMRDGLQSGADSGLASVWDEICVQIQGRESVLWQAYDGTVRAMVSREVQGLPPAVLSALWLQTRRGEEWLEDEEEGDEVNRLPGIPYDVGDVVDHVVGMVYGIAAQWSNHRIRAYLGDG